MKVALSFLNALFPSFSNSFNIPFLSVVRAQGYSSALFPFGDAISRIRELENFLLRAMENVDICIEWMRIREFDSSGGRIELLKSSFSFVLEFV